MSYRPYNRNVSGIFYLGDQGADAPLQTTSDIIISDGGGANTYIQSANLVVADGGNIGSVSDKDAIQISAGGDVTFSQDISVAGDFTVNGTLTTLNTQTLVVNDPLIHLGSGNAADTSDLGFFAEYESAGDKFAGLFRDATDGNKFRLFYDLEERPTTTVNTGGTGYTVATLVADLEGDVTGNVTGNADTATEATNVTLTANQTTNETVYLTFADGATGTQGLETDTALNYNPSTDTLTAGTLAGNVTGDLTGNADTATALETARNFSITGEGTAAAVSFDGTAAVALSFGLDETAISNQTEKASAGAAGDQILILDSADSNNFKRITRSNFISGLGGFSNFVVSDRASSGVIDDGEYLIFTDGPTINFTYAAEGSNHTISGVVVDASIDENKLASSVAGLGIAGGGGTALSFAPSELTDAAIANGDSLVFMDNTDSNAPKVEALADVATLFAGDGLTAAASVMAVNTGAGLEIDSDAVRIATTAAGNGLSGGGGNALDLDINGLGGATLASADAFAFNDANDSNTVKKVLWSTMVQGTAGVGLSSSAAVLALDFTELTNQTAVTSGDIFVGVRGTDESQWTIDEMATRLAGPGIAVSGDGIMTVTGGDFSGATLENITATDTMLYVDAGDSETKRSSLTALANILTDGSNSALRNDGADIFVDIDSTSVATPEWKDKVLFEDGNVANLHQNATWADIAAEMAGDGLTVDASTMSLDVEVDDSTIEIATDTVQVKDGGITFAKMEAATIVTEAEGIDNNDNDTTLPTSAAVKDYVDNLSGLSVVTQTAAALTVTTEDVVLCDTSSNAITVTLPENGGDVGSGRRVTVKKTTSDGNTVTISRQTADTIDGATTYILYSQNESSSFVCDGANWFIV